jgi:hypothetical protein
MAEDNLRSNIVTIYGEIEFIIRISQFKKRNFFQFTLKIEAAGSPETSVHIIAHKTVIQTIRLFSDTFRTSELRLKKK